VFGAESNLQRIQKEVFADAILREIELPNSVRVIDGRACPKVLKSGCFISVRPISAFAVKCSSERPAGR
jgi:hypothetical protein